VEESHQGADLDSRPRPVLSRKGVDRERFDAELLSGVEDTLDGADPGAMPEAGGAAAAASPAPVAVHDDPDVAGDLRVQGQHSVPGVQRSAF